MFPEPFSPAPAPGGITFIGQPAIPTPEPTGEVPAVPAVPDACRDLALTPNILERLVEDLHRSGLTGEDRTGKTLFLALVSRIFDRPISVAVKGPSSAGKSHTVGTVLKFFPESAYYAVTAMSPKALAYDAEPLKNRFIIIYEA